VFRYPNIYVWKGRDDRKRGKVRSIALGFEMNTATRRLIIDATRSGLRMGLRGEAGGLVVYDRALMSQIGLCTLKEWRWEVERGHDDIAVAYFIACLTREQYPPPRMSFAPKNTAEFANATPQEQMADLGVNIQRNPELEAMFLREMKRIRTSAGITANMRGTGKRSINRLYGI